MAIRFDQADARPMGRNTRGVKGINLQKDDEVVGMVVADPDGYLLTVCENGYGKRHAVRRQHRRRAGRGGSRGGRAGGGRPGGAGARGGGARSRRARKRRARKSPAMHYRKQRRGGKGVRDIRTASRNGPVVGVAAVRDTDDVVISSTSGMVTRMHASEIRMVGRNTQGVRVINLKEGDKCGFAGQGSARGGRERRGPGR